MGRVLLGGNLILQEIHTLTCLIFIERVDKYSHDSVSLLYTYTKEVLKVHKLNTSCLIKAQAPIGNNTNVTLLTIDSIRSFY